MTTTRIARTELDQSDLYPLHTDNQLAFSTNRRVVKALLNLFALLGKRLIINDSYLLNNISVQHLVQQGEFGELLKRGIIIPALRSRGSELWTFERLFDDQKQFDRPDECKDEGYAKQLDDLSSKVLYYDLDTLSSNYTASIEQCMTDAVLFEKLGMLDEFEDITQAFDSARGDSEKVLRRHLYSVAESSPYGGTEFEQRIKRIADAPYITNLPDHLAIVQPLIPPEFSDAFYLSHFGPASLAQRSGLLSEALIREIEDSLVTLAAFNTDALSSLTPQHILVLRELASYQNMIRATSSEDISGQDFAAAVLAGLTGLENEIIYMTGGAHKQIAEYKMVVGYLEFEDKLLDIIGLFPVVGTVSTLLSWGMSMIVGKYEKKIRGLEETSRKKILTRGMLKAERISDYLGYERGDK